MKRVTDLIHDFMRQDIWEELLTAAENVSDRRVKEVNDKLLRVRDTTMEGFEEENLRMQGITLCEELKALRGEELKRALPILPQIHETFGSPDYAKYIEFMLGRGLTVSRLYTTDYVNFYPEPQGQLVHEGGFWYQTNHIDLSVEQMDELGEDAEEFIQSIYYRYAPIEDVIYRMSNMIRLIAKFTLSTGIALGKERIYARTYEDVQLRVFPKMMHGMEYDVQLVLMNGDGAEQILVPDEIETSIEHTYKNGVIVPFVDKTQHVNISTMFEGRKLITTVEVYEQGIIPVPDSVYVALSDNDMYIGKEVEFILMGVYLNFRMPIPDQEAVEWSHSNTEDCYMVDNRIGLRKEIREVKTDTVTGRYYNQQQFEDSSHVEIHPTQTGVFPTHLSLQTSRNVFQGESHKVYTYLHYSDGSNKIINSYLRSSAAAAPIHADRTLNPEITYLDYTTKITAEYKEDGYNFTAELDVLCKYRIYELTSFTVEGQATVNENSTSHYTAIATWENGSKQQVDASWRVLRYAGSPTVRARIDGNGMLTTPHVDQDSIVIVEAQIKDEHGKFHTATKAVTIVDVKIYPQSLELITDKTSLNLGERTYCTVYKVWSDGARTLVPKELYDRYNIFVIQSPDTYVQVRDDSRGTYIEYDEGVPQIVEAYARINFGDAQDPLMLQSQKYPVSLIVSTVKLQEIKINEHKFITEGSREMFGAQAVWEDGRTEEVEADWTFTYESDDVDDEDLDITQGNFSLRDLSRILTSEDLTLDEILEHPDLMKYPEFRGINEADLDNVILNRVIAQARWLHNEQERHVDINARYYKTSADTETTVTKIEQALTNPILSARISGPLEFYSDRIEVSYALNVKFDNECAAYNVSSDWSLDVGSDIADISSSGFLTPRTNEDHWITITATIDCNGQFLQRSLRVHMKMAESRFNSLNILGPTNVIDGQKHQYTANLDRKEEPSDEVDYGQIEFSIETDAEVHLDVLSGVLTVNTLTEDHPAIIRAFYEEYDYKKSVQYESISSEKHILLIAARKLTKVDIDVPYDLEDTMGEYQFTCTGTRADGSSGQLNPITDPKAQVIWRLPNYHEGLTLSEEGLLTMGVLPKDTVFQVECIVYEGNNVVRDLQNVSIIANSAPTAITIVGLDTIRYMGTYDYIALLQRKDGRTEDVTHKCYWSVSPEDFYLDINRGTYEISKSFEDLDTVLSVSYTEGSVTLEADKQVAIRSTLPLFGTEADPVDEENVFEYLKDKLGSTDGGNLSFVAEDEEFGYLAYPREMGEAVFVPIGTNASGGWKKPWLMKIEIEEGVIEEWLMYQTENKGFGFASFSVSFDNL